MRNDASGTSFESARAFPSSQVRAVTRLLGGPLNWLRWNVTQVSEASVRFVFARIPRTLRRRLLFRLEQSGRPPTMSIRPPDPRRHSVLVESVVVSDPQTLVVPAGGPFAHEELISWPAREAHCLSDVVLDLPTGLLFHRDRVVMESAGDYRFADDSAFVTGAVFRVRHARSEPLLESVVSVGKPSNYYHFMVEFLPRILAVGELDPTVRVLFHGDPPAWAAGILSLLGFRYLSVETEVVHAERVWVVDPGLHTWPHPRDLDRVVCAVDRVVPRSDQAGGKLFVSRKGTARTIDDEEGLSAHLVNLGFLAVSPLALSFEAQIEHFRSASTVVGEHGAGLVNIMFMPPGSRVLELTTGSWWNGPYRRISAIRQLEYELVEVSSSDDMPNGTGPVAWLALKDKLR